MVRKFDDDSNARRVSKSHQKSGGSSSDDYVQGWPWAGIAVPARRVKELVEFYNAHTLDDEPELPTEDENKASAEDEKTSDAGKKVETPAERAAREQRELEDEKKAAARTAFQHRVENELFAAMKRIQRVPARLRHALFAPPAYLELYELSGERKDKREAETLKALLDRLLKHGPVRKLSRPRPDWLRHIEKLQADMPNFRSVLDFLRGELSIAEAARTAPHLPPILLDGPPGVGKTLFATKLAQLLRTDFLAVSMESAQTATALTGSEEYWGNSKHGQLFHLMINAENANPLILVDEVDKARTGQYDPASALYALLEEGSARRWHDLSMPQLQLDVSRANWILTSNSRGNIASPLLSRMCVFDIPALTQEQARGMVSRIFTEVVRHSGVRKFNLALPYAAIATLATASPRQIRRLCRELIGVALIAGRREVIQSDLRHLPLDATVRARWDVVAVVVRREEESDEPPVVH